MALIGSKEISQLTFNISHGTFHNKILLHIPVTTMNLSCLYMVLLLASVSE